jgi:hypothetical protein
VLPSAMSRTETQSAVIDLPALVSVVVRAIFGRWVGLGLGVGCL